MSSEFDSKLFQVPYIKVMKVDIVGRIAVIYSVLSLSLDSLNDLNHNIGSISVFFSILRMFNVHKLSQTHLRFVYGPSLLSRLLAKSRR